MHIAQIGTGRVGRPTAYSILCAGLADTLTVCDVKPGLAVAFAEELKHVTASIGADVEIVACERDDEVANADLILISAGEPRAPGVQMSRRDLAVQNARIVKYIAETARSNNPGAKYVVISNPVDAMAMICKKYTKADFVISTGTNLESLRFRSKIAETLQIPVTKVKGWVAGEHGDAAIPLWSTTKINDTPIDAYVEAKSFSIPKDGITFYVKSISKVIVDNIGGTEYGPAASFRDITRAIVQNTNEIQSIAAPVKFEELPEPVFVGLPTQLGNAIGKQLYEELSLNEKVGILGAAEAIYKTYQTVLERIE
ncbi:MAG: malate dehydrogenase [Candidatus Bathyarchaeia archaeon]